MIHEGAKTLIAIDPDQLRKEMETVNMKLDKLLSSKQENHNSMEVDWITSKKFMEITSIKSFSGFYKVLDNMQEIDKKKIGGKIYVHKDTVRKYFEGQFS